MQGRLTGHGELFITRNGVTRLQECMRSPTGRARACGHQCPLFGENRVDVQGIKIDMCDARTLVFDAFADERIRDNI